MGSTVSKANHGTTTTEFSPIETCRRHLKSLPKRPKLNEMSFFMNSTRSKKSVASLFAKDKSSKKRSAPGSTNESTKKRKNKQRKVTKSIIGKPTNFQHTSHMGADGFIENYSTITSDSSSQFASSHLLEEITVAVNASRAINNNTSHTSLNSSTTTIVAPADEEIPPVPKINRKALDIALLDLEKIKADIMQDYTIQTVFDEKTEVPASRPTTPSSSRPATLNNDNDDQVIDMTIDEPTEDSHNDQFYNANYNANANDMPIFIDEAACVNLFNVPIESSAICNLESMPFNKKPMHRVCKPYGLSGALRLNPTSFQVSTHC